MVKHVSGSIKCARRFRVQIPAKVLRSLEMFSPREGQFNITAPRVPHSHYFRNVHWFRIRNQAKHIDRSTLSPASKLTIRGRCFANLYNSSSVQRVSVCLMNTVLTLDSRLRCEEPWCLLGTVTDANLLQLTRCSQSWSIPLPT